MNAGTFHMLHNARYQNILAVTDSVNFQLHALQIFVDKHQIIHILLQNNRHIFTNISLRKGNNHILAAQNV